MGLAGYIEEDLKACLSSGAELPCRLTLGSLAGHYRVSLTPVRVAIDRLIAEGMVRKRSNGRLEVARPPRRVGEPPRRPTAPPATRDWDQVLVKEVMLSSLGREAVYLREEALARKHAVGRSVIRQSLGRLAGAGLIEHVPRCGWLVHPIREDDVQAYLEVREVLELKALDLARPHLVREELEAMLEGNPQLAEGEPPRLDNRLHQYLVAKSGNRYIQRFFRQYTASYYTAVFDYAAPEAHVVAEMALQHRQILEALIAKRWARAREVLAEHIRAQQPVLRNLLGLGDGRRTA
jgi:DNA-binding GntR family transcriptional regulator